LGEFSQINEFSVNAGDLKKMEGFTQKRGICLKTEVADSSVNFKIPKQSFSFNFEQILPLKMINY
jgi:hypothetical protein